jgi:hypothetical protein
MSLTKATFSMIESAPISVSDFGAVGDGVTDDTAAIQAAIDYAYSLANGGNVWFNGTYAISSTLTIGTNVHLCGVAKIKQITDNTPIIKVNKGAFNERWSISGLTLEYANQQTSAETNARALVLCEANKFSYLFTVENVKIIKAFKGVEAPEETGSFAFLGTFNNVHILQSADWGFDWSNATVGSSTFLSLNNVWVSNTSGSEIATSKGFRIKRCDSLCITSIAVDHVQNSPVLFDSCFGSVDTISIESCDLTASSGGVFLFTISGGSVSVTELNLVGNNVTISGTATSGGLRASDVANIRVDVYRDNLNTVVDTSSDNYYSVNTTTTGTAVFVKDYVYSPAGANPAPNGTLADFTLPYKVWEFNNNKRQDQRGGKIHLYGTAFPVTGTWAVGDIMWNTNPVAGGTIGWVCTTAGTSGTWKTFGTIAV